MAPGGLIASYAVAAGTDWPIRQAWQCWQIFGVGMLAAGAALCIGFGVGFIFAIPQEERKGIKVSESPTEETPWTPTPNDNLKEISDWLTKIIVGVGLVELKQFPIALKGLAWYLGPGLRAPDRTGDWIWIAERAGLTIVLYYLSTGFLLGYIWTKLYFHRDLELARLKREAKNRKEEADRAREAKKAEERGNLIGRAEADIFLGNLDKAMEAIEKALSIDKTDARALLTKARILKRQALQTGLASEQGTALLRQAVELTDQFIGEERPYRAEALYNKACYLYFLGADHTLIFELLRKAFELNSEIRAYAKTDDDFASLRGDPEFRRIVGLPE